MTRVKRCEFIYCSSRSRKSDIVSKSKVKQTRGEPVCASLETEQYAAPEKWWLENGHLWVFVQSIEEYDEVRSEPMKTKAVNFEICFVVCPFVPH